MKRLGMLSMLGAVFVVAGCSEGVMEPAVTLDGISAVFSEEETSYVDQGSETVLQLTTLSDGTTTYHLPFTAVGSFSPDPEPDGGPFIFAYNPLAQNQAITVSVLGARSGDEGANANVCGIRQFRLQVINQADGADVVNIGEPVYTDQLRFAPGTGDDCLSVLLRDFDWPIIDEGEIRVDPDAKYTIRASGVYRTPPPQPIDFDADAEVTDVEFELTVEVELRVAAAPAIAAYLLHQAEIRPLYRNGRTLGNHIADVALEMARTPTTDFAKYLTGGDVEMSDGEEVLVAKEDSVAYCTAIQNFLVNKDPSADVGGVSCVIEVED